MPYALAQPSLVRRSGLLGLVIGLHVGIFLLILAAKTIVPQILEMPMVVDLLPAPEMPKPPAVKALAPAKPQPAKLPPSATPKKPTPPIEAAASTVAAPATPLAAAPEVTPAAAAAPAEAPIAQARFDADYLNNPAPRYPPLSRRMGEEGQVILRVSVNPQGSAEHIEIRTSSGSTRLDDAAVNTVKRWKFIPAKRGDNAIQSWVLVPIIFKLEQ